MYDLNKKLIFTHPIKCGGTSVEDLLGFFALREKYPQVQSTIKHASLETHFNELKNKNVKIEDFFKFSIIRNPWARAVSFYNHSKYRAFEHWLKTKPNKEMPPFITDSRNMTFKSFIFKYTESTFNSNYSTKPYMLFQNKFYLDYVIRLEHLKEDFLKIRDKLQLKSDTIIPHHNNSETFLPKKPYTEYYDAETKKLIEQRFDWDIETFNYTY